MRISVIGTGNVGGALGRNWARNGHEVIFGSRDIEADRTRALLAEAGDAQALPVAAAIAASHIVVLATPWDATEGIIRSTDAWDGKILVDCTNPLRQDLSGLTVSGETSGGEKIAGWAEGAAVVKAFNTTGANNMADSRYGDDKIAMFLCGDDGAAKATVAELAAELGFEPVDAGGITAARYLEAVAMLWIGLAYVQGLGNEIALQLVSR